MSRKQTLWLVPVLLALHNLEEALTLPRLLPSIETSTPAWLRAVLPVVTVPQFLTALLVVTVIPFLVCIFGRLDRQDGAAVYTLVAVQATLVLNGLSHLGSAFVMGGYSPGLVTALTINLPFAIYLLRRVVRERWLSRNQQASLMPVVFVLHGPVLLGLMVVSGSLSRLL